MSQSRIKRLTAQLADEPKEKLIAIIDGFEHERAALQSRLSSCEKDLSVARQSLYKVAEQRNNAMQDAFQKGCRLDRYASRLRGLFVALRQSEGMTMQEGYAAWEQHGKHNLLVDEHPMDSVVETSVSDSEDEWIRNESGEVIGRVVE